MAQRHTFCSSTYNLALNCVALHTIVLSSVTQSSSIYAEHTLFLLSSISIMIGLFGMFFITKGQSFRLNSKLQQIIEKALFLLFVACTGAIGNALQNGTLNFVGGVTGLFVGGAIGGIVAGIGALANQVIEKWSSTRLTIFWSSTLHVICHCLSNHNFI